jgi:transcriptional regulator with XRE-family HTH domain
MKELPVVTSQKTEYRFTAGALRNYRTEVLNISMRELARRAGVSANYLSRIETNGARVSEEFMVKLKKAIAKGFVSKLLGDTDEKSQTE